MVYMLGDVGAYICTISAWDWYTARSKGVYGNRYDYKDNGLPLSDSNKLSIIRDMISIREGDIIFFHIKGEKKIRGIFQARSNAFFDTNPIWNNPYDNFPVRFLFASKSDLFLHYNADAEIKVESLYEIIDQNMIESLVTLENEQNIEARAVKRIFLTDAMRIIRLLYRDLNYHVYTNLKFQPYFPRNPIDLRNKIDHVGRYENAIKSIISWMLANKDKSLLEPLDLCSNFDFVNEFIIAPTTRKAIDFLIKTSEKFIIIEVKNNRCDLNTLKQVLYYSDLIDQRPWSRKREKIVVLVGQRFSRELIDKTDKINRFMRHVQIKLIKYEPILQNRWAIFTKVV